MKETWDNHIGILWGGGLGDLLVIRPFILALHKAGARVSLISSVKHATGLFSVICPEAKHITLPDKPLSQLVDAYHLHNRFDQVYIGPYPTLLTRIFARLISNKVWHRRHVGIDRFVLEQILADMEAIGLGRPDIDELFPASLPWSVSNNKTANEPYYVFHPGSKPGWKTKQWPMKNWSALINKYLENKSGRIYLIGTIGERDTIEGIAQNVEANLQQQITTLLSPDLADLTRLIHHSRGVICHNSGIMNLSMFLKKETIVLTGSSADYWRPPYPWILNLSSGTCNLACNRYRCPVPGYNAKCITRLDMNTVFNESLRHFQ